MIVLSTTPMVSVTCSRNEVCTSVNGAKEPSSITASTASSNSTGSTITLTGAASPRPERDLHVVLAAP